MTRRAFALKLGGVIAALLGSFAIDQPATAAGQISFRAPMKGTVLANTIKKYPTWVLSSGYVYKVSSLAGRLVFEVNNKRIGTAAGKYTVAKGATITWKHL